ncbi:MAG TPA: NUDIX hydrolase [Verrucomicrobiae bacterium]|jgi:8-oxo-dGTP pyrophosphatase MutT (NUDIX family)
MIEAWRTISSKQKEDYRVFSVRQDRKVSPRTGKEHDFFVIDTTNWVNIIAMTPEDQVVFVEQYRHGSGTVELELPGGVMDAEDKSPEATASRELLEETGYEAKNPQVIGKIFPNPAIMNNSCFTVVANNCRYVKPVQFDHAEDLATRLVPLAELPQLVAAGKIRHALMVAALYEFDLWLKVKK